MSDQIGRVRKCYSIFKKSLRKLKKKKICKGEMTTKVRTIPAPFEHKTVVVTILTQCYKADIKE